MPCVVTCGYCGTRTALGRRGGRCNLACDNCGGPLPAASPLKVQRPKVKAASKARRTKKKPRLGRLLGELFDEIEDLFD